MILFIKDKELTIEKDDLIRFWNVEGQKPEIRIKDAHSTENKFTLLFEDHDTFEYFALKMNRILLSFRNPTMTSRLDTARMKTILLNKELNKITTKVR